jgi:hypothetical protein
MLKQPGRPPADRGLSSLGLLMTLGGSVAAPVAAASLLTALVTDGRLAREFGRETHTLALVLVLVLALARSLAQRAAGIRLWRSLPDSPPALVGIRRYVGLAALHAGAVIVYVGQRWDLAPLALGGVVLTFMAWPVAVLLITRRSRFVALGSRPPAGEDNGFEGLAILMAIFGSVGLACLALLGLVLARELHDAYEPLMLLVAGALVALIYRSWLHVATAVRALRGNPATSGPAFLRYGERGVKVGVGVSCAMMIVAFTESVGLLTLLQVVALLLALLAWPALVQRFVSWRVLADVNTGVVRGPAPDGGVTALGWLLIAASVLSLGVVVARYLDASAPAVRVLAMHGMPVHADGRGWGQIVIGLQLWAGIELLEVSTRRKLVATAWALAAIAHAVVTQRALLVHVFGGELDLEARAGILFLLALTLPMATLALVHRRGERVDLAQAFT